MTHILVISSRCRVVLRCHLCMMRHVAQAPMLVAQQRENQISASPVDLPFAVNELMGDRKRKATYAAQIEYDEQQQER